MTMTQEKQGKWTTWQSILAFQNKYHSVVSPAVLPDLHSNLRKEYNPKKRTKGERRSAYDYQVLGLIFNVLRPGE